jgi:hypothetical protein
MAKKKAKKKNPKRQTYKYTTQKIKDLASRTPQNEVNSGTLEWYHFLIHQ